MIRQNIPRKNDKKLNFLKKVINYKLHYLLIDWLIYCNSKRKKIKNIYIDNTSMLTQYFNFNYFINDQYFKKN
jgi:hypothetical protein